MLSSMVLNLVARDIILGNLSLYLFESMRIIRKRNELSNKEERKKLSKECNAFYSKAWPRIALYIVSGSIILFFYGLISMFESVRPILKIEWYFPVRLFVYLAPVAYLVICFWVFGSMSQRIKNNKAYETESDKASNS